MSLKTTIKSGIGEPFEAEVNQFHALKVFNSLPSLPPLGTENRVKFFKETVSGMAVDGSITPQTFALEASQDFDIHITNILIVLADGSLQQNKFGALAVLTNGWDLIVKESGVDTYLLEKVKTNGQISAYSGMFNTFGSTSTVNLLSNWLLNDDALIVRMDLSTFVPGGVRLGRGTLDSIRGVVNDDLTGLSEFEFTVFGHRVSE